MMSWRTFALILLCFCSSAWGGDCKRTGSVCVDATPCKTVSGQQVCLSQFGLSCWEYKDTYTCLKPNAVNYCQPLINLQPRCWQTGSQCIETDTVLNTGCMKYTQTWRCDDPNLPAPPNTTVLDTSYTITTDELDTSQCDPSKNNPNCTLASHTCTEPGGTRNINGLDVYKDCWQWTDEYVCASDQKESDCGALAGDPNCSYLESECIDPLPGGQCGVLEKTYQCQIAEGSVEEIITCDNMVCVNGRCSGPSTNPDMDFASVITGLEAAREMGMYLDPATMQMFRGQDGKCSKKLGGLSNCCKGGGGGKTSNNFMLKGAMMLGNEAIRFLGSSYMHDALFATDMVPSGVLEFLYGSGGGAEYVFGGSGGFGFYGITFSFASEGAITVGFDPYSFALAIAMQVLMEFLSCEQEEQVLAMRKNQNLCHRVGSYCASKVLGVCLEKKESYCCFNSRLARIINEQGRKQLGRGWGSAKNPKCDGFTQDDLAQLDFSKMDLEAFFREIVPKNLNTKLLTERANTAIQNKVNNYYSQ